MVVLLLVAAARVSSAEEEPTWEGQGVPAWMKLLGSEEVSERQQAAYALWQLADRDSSASKDLARALADSDEYVAKTSLSALEKMGPGASAAVPVLAELVTSDEPAVALSAIGILQQLGEKALAAVPALNAAVKTDDQRRKTTVAWCLARIQGLAAFRSSEPEVRAAAAQLPKFDGIRDREKLVHALVALVEADPVAKVRAAAANVLQLVAFSLHPDEYSGVISVLLQRAGEEKDPEVRTQLIHAIGSFAGRSKDPRLVAVLVTSFDQGETEERVAALGGMCRLESLPPQALARVLKAVGDPDPRIRGRATTALGAAEPTEEVMAALIEALEDWEPGNRALAASTLGSFGERATKAVPALLTALKEAEDRRSLKAVAVALAGMGDPARIALPELKKMLAEANPPPEVAYAVCRLGQEVDDRALRLIAEVACSDVGGSALWLLVRLGARAEGAVPVLVAALGTARPYLIPDIVITLGKLGPTARAARPTLLALKAESTGELLEFIDQALESIPED
jgi:HEAT repeat protein